MRLLRRPATAKERANRASPPRPACSPPTKLRRLVSLHQATPACVTSPSYASLFLFNKRRPLVSLHHATPACFTPPSHAGLFHSTQLRRLVPPSGTAVAVVFDFDDGAAYPFRGDVVRVLRTSARVRFADGGTLDVAFNQLLRITGSYKP